MDDLFEARITDIVKHFPYPPKPIKATTKTPLRFPSRLAHHVASLLLIAGLIAIAIPDIRAAILDYLQIGNVTIYLDGFDSNDEPLRLDDVMGETDLETAQSMLKFEMLVPTDRPDRVYVQNEDMVILVWIDGEKIDKALYQSRGFDWGTFKGRVKNVIQVEVAGHYAVWIEVPHSVQFVYKDTAQEELTYFVSGNVLIWDAGNITYRLETMLTMEEAISYAESLYQ